MKTELVYFKEGAAKDYRLPPNTKIGKDQRQDDISDVMNKMKSYRQ